MANRDPNASEFWLCKMALLLCLNWIIPPASGFSFVEKIPTFKSVLIELEGITNYSINCLTTDSMANVSLLYGHDGKAPSELTVGGRILVDNQLFTIHNISSLDGGEYTCKARNSQGSVIQQQQFLYIRQEELPCCLAVMPERKIIITSGTSINITCRADMSRSLQKYMHMEWLRKEGDTYKTVPANEIHSKITPTSYSLTLMVIKAKHTSADGIPYKCQFHYRNKEDYSFFRLLVKDLSAPNVTLRTTLMVREPRKLRVRCMATGFPAPWVSWFHNGDRMSLCPTFTNHCQGKNYLVREYSSTEAAQSESNLIIVQTRYPRDNGSYVCAAKNSQGEDKKTVQVSVQTAPRLKKDREYLLFIQKGKKIFCEGVASPIPVFTWKYQFALCLIENFLDCTPSQGDWVDLPSGHTVSTATRPEKTRSTVTIPSSVSLAFFKCTAANRLGKDENVLKFYAGGSSDKIKINSKKATYDEDSSLSVECYMLTKGSVIGWFKNGEQLSSASDSRINITSDVEDTWISTRLVITSLTVTDAGLYTCKAQVFGSQSLNASKEFTVNRVFPPRILSFDNQTVFDKHSVELFCNISAYPPATVEWFKEGSSLADSVFQLLHQSSQMSPSLCDSNKLLQGFYVIKANPSILLICDPLDKPHSGEYTCQAKNSKGNASATAFLEVFERPRIIDLKLFEEEVVVVGEAVNISCQARGNPLPMVQWKKNKGNMPVSAEQAGDKGAYLFLASLGEDEYGNYTCVAVNSKGAVYATLKLVPEVTDPPPVIASQGLPQEAVIGLGVFGALTFLVAVMGIVCFAFFRHQRKQIEQYRSQFFPNYIEDYKIDPDRSLLEQCNNLPYDPDWEFPEERLILGDVLGSGAFGQVFKAEAIGIVDFNPRDKSAERGRRRSKMLRRSSSSKMYQDSKGNAYTRTTVAVKTLKDGAEIDEYRDLASELKMLIHIGEHNNIVNLLGACTKGHRLLIIMEYVPHGNLLKFLRDKRDIYDPIWTKTTNDPEIEFTIANLVDYAYQIARGMEFLASRKCIHRDLAARNVLVGEDYVMKIADFGLARDVYKSDLYVKTTSGVLPVKWMALESLFDRVYTENSDVWSYGICLWEIFTLGGTPYPGIPTEELLDFLSEGKRMEQPQNCPLEIYTIMRDCWEQKPILRPVFCHISERIGRILELRASKQSSSAYVSFTQDNGDRSGQDYYLTLLESGSAAAQGGGSGIDRESSYQDITHSPLPSSSINPLELEMGQEEAQRALGRQSSGSVSEDESGIELEESLREADEEHGTEVVDGSRQKRDSGEATKSISKETVV